MNKKFFAAAVALALSTPVFADSGFYIQADAGISKIKLKQERLGVAIPSAPMPNVQASAKASAKVQKAASTYKQDAQALITGTKSGTVGAYTPLFESDPERIRATRMEGYSLQ